MKRRYTIDTEQWLPKPVEDVFAFFGDAGNLELLTPPFLGFEILTAVPIEMSAGTVIDYRLRVHGIPLRWRTRIRAWEPAERFIDEQIRGPHRFWVHEHTFESEGAGARVRDHVEYGVPGGRLAHALFVRRDVERIFRYRGRRLAELFGSDDPGSVTLGITEGRR